MGRELSPHPLYLSAMEVVNTGAVKCRTIRYAGNLGDKILTGSLVKLFLDTLSCACRLALSIIIIFSDYLAPLMPFNIKVP